MNEHLSEADYAGFLMFAAQERQEALLLELAGVLDSFDRVLAAGPDPDPAAGHERLRLLAGQLERFSRSMGLEPLGTPGEDFEPALHQVVEVRPAADIPADAVVEVLQRGYRFDGRLLRPARVAVAGPPAADESPGDPREPHDEGAAREPQDQAVPQGPHDPAAPQEPHDQAVPAEPPAQADQADEKNLEQP